MKIHQTVCDVCGTPKKETNNWLFAATIPIADGFGFLLSHDRPSAPAKDLCGQECSTKLLSLWLTTGSIDSQALREAVTL